MEHSIGSIREMVRQYREELSCQTTSDDVSLHFDASFARNFLKSEEVDYEKRASSPNEEHHAETERLTNKRHVSWHDSLMGTAYNVIQEKTCTCIPLRFNTDDLEDFHDLDHYTTEVLQRSQQVIERGQACKSSMALISKLGHSVDYIQAPSYFTGNRNSSQYRSGTIERRSHKNYCRARNVVARNFEEIDQILGESNLVMEPSSSSDIQHKTLDYTKIGKEIRQASKESKFEPIQSLHRGVEHLKQDIEAREEAVIKATNYYLNKGNGHSNVQSERLLENPLAHTEEEFTSTCRRSWNASKRSAGNAHPACYPSTFNTNPQQEWQTTMSLLFATLEPCQRTKICDKSVPLSSSVTPIIHSKIKWPKIAEDDRQWLNNSRQFDSKIVDFASMVDIEGTWKYAEDISFDKGHFGSTKSLELDGGLPMSSRNFAITTIRQQPSTEDIEQYPISTKEKLMNKSLKIRDICSIQMPKNHATYFGQELRTHDSDVSVSESQSCIGRLVRGALHGSLSLEDDMRQLSIEDLLLVLENPRRIRANLKSLSSKDQFDASCEEQKTYQPEQYLSSGKCSTSLIAKEFESSFTGGLDGKDEELTTYNSAVLASLKQDYKEAFDQTSPQASRSHRYLLKSNRGTKDKDNKSPAWMHSLNVRKPTKWRAMSITHHTRLQANSAANQLIKGTAVVEELEEQLALRHCNSGLPKDTILAVNSNFKGRSAQEEFDCSLATTASIPNNNPVINYSKLAGNHENISKTGIHGSDGQLAYGIISLPEVLTVQDNNHCVINSLVAQEFDNLPINYSTFSSGLDYLISEVVHEWVEICSTPSPTCDGSQEFKRTMSPLTTYSSITEEVSSNCPAGMQVSEAGNKWSASQAHFRKKVQVGSKSLPRDSDLMKDVRKLTSVAALASVVQPLIAALQEAQIEESIVTEFEADETVRLLLEKLQFYETKIRALKINRRKSKSLSSAV